MDEGLPSRGTTDHELWRQWGFRSLEEQIISTKLMFSKNTVENLHCKNNATTLYKYGKDKYKHVNSTFCYIWHSEYV